MKKMFVTDLDGTLFTDDKKIHEQDIKALEYLGNIGVIRAFATGRSLHSFEGAIKKMGFAFPSFTCKESSAICNDPLYYHKAVPVDYIIFSTGAGIMRWPNRDLPRNTLKTAGIIDRRVSGQGEIIKKYSLESEDVSLIANYFDHLKLDYMVHRPVPDTPYFIYKQQSGRMNPDFDSRVKLYKNFSTKVDSSVSVKDFGPATELLAIVPAEQGDDMVDIIQHYLSDFSVIRATSPLDGKSVWIEVFNRSVSKSKAISWLAEHLGIVRQDVISIGNDYNDLDMLEWAGNGFVVNNAPNAFKKKFASVASNNECGVSQAISKAMVLNDKVYDFYRA